MAEGVVPVCQVKKQFGWFQAYWKTCSEPIFSAFPRVERDKHVTYLKPPARKSMWPESQTSKVLFNGFFDFFSFLGGDAFWFLLFEIHHDRGVWRFYNDPLEFTRDWREYNLGLGYRWVLPISLQKQRKKVKPYLKLMASVHLNIDFGVSVCNGPLSVMQVWWAAPKIKATSYYSNHILSAAHMTCSNPHRIRYAIWYMIAIMKRIVRNTGMRIMKMIIKNRRDCM